MKDLHTLDLFEINHGIMADRKRIEDNMAVLWKLAERKANTELEYRKALAMKVEELRIEKVPATLIKDLAEGEIAEKRRDWELACGQYQACRASLEALQTSINALMSILKHFEKI